MNTHTDEASPLNWLHDGFHDVEATRRRLQPGHEADQVEVVHRHVDDERVVHRLAERPAEVVVDAEVDLRLADRSQAPRRDHLPGRLDDAAVAVVLAHRQLPAEPLRRLDEREAVLARAGQGLLHEHRQARLEAARGHLAVGRRGHDRDRHVRPGRRERRLEVGVAPVGRHAGERPRRVERGGHAVDQPAQLDVLRDGRQRAQPYLAEAADPDLQHAHGSARAGHFTAPAVVPAATYFWAMTSSTTAGREAITAVAMTALQSLTKLPM